MFIINIYSYEEPYDNECHPLESLVVKLDGSPIKIEVTWGMSNDDSTCHVPGGCVPCPRWKLHSIRSCSSHSTLRINRVSQIGKVVHILIYRFTPVSFDLTQDGRCPIWNPHTESSNNHPSCVRSKDRHSMIRFWWLCLRYRLWHVSPGRSTGL